MTLKYIKQNPDGPRRNHRRKFLNNLKVGKGLLVWCKIYSQNSLAHLYTNNKRSKREIKKTIPFTITGKTINYLGINLPQEAKDLYSENYQIPMKEGNGTPLQYFCLENPMDGGAWWAAVHGVARVRHDWATSLSLFTFMHWRRKWQPTPVFLPGESQGWGSLVGCRLWGRTESDTTEAT